MAIFPTILHQILDVLIHPKVFERFEAIEKARSQLPPALLTGLQALGRQNAGCSATFNLMEQCDLRCKACYLSARGNSTPPLAFEEIRKQIDAIRKVLGPWGNIQITGGEVTLLPVDNLARIIRYCRKLELDPMLMTNGETFRRDPTYLEALVSKSGLKKLAIHVDTTQKGRRGHQNPKTEAELHVVREEFAHILRETRKKTGVPVTAAHTFTVTRKTIDQIPEVVSWVMKNTDVFQMLSLQPAASVGRTSSKNSAGQKIRDELWIKIEESIGRPLNPRALLFGHPSCSKVSLLLLIQSDRHRDIIEIHRKGNRADSQLIEGLLSSQLAGYCHDVEPQHLAIARLIGLLARDPALLASLGKYGLNRTFEERSLIGRFMWSALRGKKSSVHPFSIVVHNFMNPEELEEKAGKNRLQACAFKLAVADRMIPMCEMNATGLRDQLNEQAFHSSNKIS